MAPIYIIIAFILAWGISKLYHPHSSVEKILISFGAPIVLIGVIELIIGFAVNWNGYLMGKASVFPFIGGAALIVALLIFLKKDNSDRVL